MKRSFERKIALLLCAVMLSSAILTSCGSLFGRQEESTEGTSAPSSSETEDKTPDSTESGNGSGDIGESGDGHVHNYDYSGVVTPPTCTAKGYTTYTCECGHSYTVEDPTIPAHTPVIDERVEPTFTSSGLTEGSHCGVCYEILVPQVKIPKKVATATLTSPTFEVNGYKISGRVPYATEKINLAEHIFLSPDVNWAVVHGIPEDEVVITPDETEEIRDVVPPYETEGVILPGGTPEYSEDIDIPDEPETEIEPIDTAIEPIETEIGADFYEVPVETAPPEYSEDIYEPDDYPPDYTIPEQTYDFIETESFTETESLPDETTEDYPPIIIDPPMIDPFPEDNKTVTLYEGENTINIRVINPDGITTYYTLNIYRNHLYTVAFDANGGSEVDIQYVEEGHLATAPTTEREGYTFVSWDYDFTNPVKNDLAVTANWIANENTSYTVEYYLENIAKDGYTLVETDILEGATDTPVYAVKKNFEHFTLNSDISVPSGNVTGDGSLVLKLFYTRKEYNVTALSGNTQGGTVTLAEKTTNPETDSVSSAYAYESEVTLSATTNAGYTFLGWFNGDTKLTDDPVYTFTAQGSVICSARWLANTDVAYRVEYYLQNVEQNGYELIEAETVLREGITDTTAEADLKSFERFTLDTKKSILTGNISGDGALVLKVYYTRDTYTVTVEANKGGKVSVGDGKNTSGSFAYGKTVTVTAETGAGYTFLGWFEGEEKVADTLSYTFTSERAVRYTAKWEANDGIAYRVEYYLQNVNKDGYYIVDTETEYLFGVADTVANAEEKVFEHFTLNESKSILNGNINGDGSLALKVYYTRDTYTVTADDASIGTVNIGGAVAYDKLITVYLTSICLGYDFIGWHSEDGEWLSNESEYTFNIECNVVAKFEVTPLMASQGLIFSSTESTCIIEGISDKTVNSITIPYYVTGIGENAFYGCHSLESVAFESNSQLESIGEGAFKDCSALTYISIPDYVMTIGDYAFYGCENIVSLTIPYFTSNIGEGAFYGCEKLSYLYIDEYSNLSSIGNYAFATCTALTSINIPYYTSNIGEGAFYGCEKLERVAINEYCALERIGDYAFYGCFALSDITMPLYLTSIGSYAFYGCSSIESIELYDNITSIGSYAFYGCKNIRDISIYAYCLLKSIEDYTFYGCSSLSYVFIPYYVTDIGEKAFGNCTSLTNIDIHQEVQKISCGAFSGCSALENITLPFIGDSLKASGDAYQYPLGYIFGTESYVGGVPTVQYYYGSSFGSTTHTTYYIPASLKSVTVLGGNILSGAFYGCDGIENITVDIGVENIGYGAFYGCSALESLTLPFVGENNSDWDGGSRHYPFGYVFGSESYEGSAPTIQYDRDAGVRTYYIPVSLKSVTILRGALFYGAFEGCSNIEYVNVGPIVNTIEGGAFYGCSSLIYISVDEGNNYYRSMNGNIHSRDLSTLIQYAIGKSDASFGVPYEVTTIESYAFASCENLENVHIPYTVTRIARNAFKNCPNLIEVVDGVSYVGNFAVGFDNSLTSVTLRYDTQGIAEGAFANSDKLTEIIIPSSVEVIGFGAFEGCSRLASITLPFVGSEKWGETDTHFGYIFGSSSIYTNDNYVPQTLKTVILTDGYYISDMAFYRCRYIEHITIPESIMSIYADAFEGCTSLKGVHINSVEAWCNIYFANYAANPLNYATNLYLGDELVREISIPYGITSIGQYTFYNCYSLESVTIPDSVESIEPYAFYGCWQLKDIIIPYGVTNISSYAFHGCQSLKNVIIPDSVTYIGEYAFAKCFDLESITLPYGIEIITIGTFSECISLKDVSIPENVAFIESYAFENCSSLRNIIIPDSVESIGLGAFSDCSRLESITLPFVGSDKYRNYTHFGYIFGAEGTYDQNRYVLPSSLKDVVITGGDIIYDYAFVDCDRIINITLPNTVTTIGTNAFYGCTSLKNINIPEGVRVIGQTAFYGCASLNNIHIPDGVTVIETGTFQNCTSLKSVTLPESIEIIAAYAFYDCAGLENVYIGYGVETIEVNAFYGCASLKSITVPESVTFIGYFAFDECPNLNRIDYSGTTSQWTAIYQNDKWNADNSPYTVYCSDGTVVYN